MRLNRKILAVTGLLLLTIIYLPVSVPGIAPCSNAPVHLGIGLFSYLIPSVAACPGPEFTITARPIGLTISPGARANSTIVLNSLFNFNGSVSLGTSPSPACAAPVCSNWSISPGSLTLGPNGTASSILTIYEGTGGVPGNLGNVTVFGTSGTMTRSVVVTVTTGTPSPDFSMTANPSSQTVQPSGTATYKIILTSVNGFSGEVNVATPMAPCSTYCWFVDPIGVQLKAGGTNSSTLTITTTTGIKPGNYSLPVLGLGGSLSHQITVYFTVPFPPDFAISANPASLAIAPSSNGTSAIQLKSINGFAGNVSLDAPCCGPAILCPPRCSSWMVNPRIVKLVAGGSANATLTISVSSLGGSGWTVQVTGTSGSLSHSVNVTFTVASGSPDFTMSVQPATQTVQPGATATASIILTSINGFSGTVGLTTPLVPCSTWCWSISPTYVRLSPGGSNSSTFTISTTTGIQPGNYSTGISGTSNGLSHGVTVHFSVPSSTNPDFSMTASSGNLTIDQGTAGTSTLSLSSLRGFTGTVNLVASVNCTGAACPSVTVGPASVNLASSGTAASTLTVSTLQSTPASTYSITVTATSGSVSHSLTISLVVTDPPASGAGGGGGRRLAF